MIKAYKYRLYPRENQLSLLNQHIGSARFIYNWGLSIKIKEYTVNKKNLSKFDLMNMLPELKKELSWLRNVNSQTLQKSLENLDSVYVRFFREKKGFPKFKSKKRSRQSFQVMQNVSIDFEKWELYIPKFKQGIPLVKDRICKFLIKQATISKSSSGKWFVSILFDDNKKLPDKPKIVDKKTVGIDLGVSNFLTLSCGTKIDNPKV